LSPTPKALTLTLTPHSLTRFFRHLRTRTRARADIDRAFLRDHDLRLALRHLRLAWRSRRVQRRSDVILTRLVWSTWCDSVLHHLPRCSSGLQAWAVFRWVAATLGRLPAVYSPPSVHVQPLTSAVGVGPGAGARSTAPCQTLTLTDGPRTIERALVLRCRTYATGRLAVPTATHAVRLAASLGAMDAYLLRCSLVQWQARARRVRLVLERSRNMRLERALGLLAYAALKRSAQRSCCEHAVDFSRGRTCRKALIWLEQVFDV
jgi:hypothetical protein